MATRKSVNKPKKEGSVLPKPEGHTILKRTVTFTERTITATAAGCLDMEDAIDLVQSAIGGSQLKLSTKLSEFLPTDPARRVFCERVKNAAAAAGCTRPFPCKASTTLGDIVDALSC